MTEGIQLELRDFMQAPLIPVAQGATYRMIRLSLMIKRLRENLVL